MQDVVNVYNLRCPIDGVEDAPVSYRVLTQIGKVLCNRLDGDDCQHWRRSTSSYRTTVGPWADWLVRDPARPRGEMGVGTPPCLITIKARVSPGPRPWG